MFGATFLVVAVAMALIRGIRWALRQDRDEREHAQLLGVVGHDLWSELTRFSRDLRGDG